MIIAYASAHASPVANPNDDPVINLNTGAALPQNVVVNGDCVDDTGHVGPFTYKWYLMSAPAGSTAAFASDTVQSPTLQNVDIWGNYRLFVVATNSVTGDVSEQDPLRAPSSAFCVIRVLSTNQAIQKPAAGERNWYNDLYVWADRIETFSAQMAPHNIIDHLDVVDATGADLEALTGGGYADDPDLVSPNPPNSFGNSLLHKHHGSDVDVATVATPGVVYLPSGFGGNPAAPTVLTDDYLMLSAHAYWCIDPLNGLVPLVTKGRTSPTGGAVPLFVWNIPSGPAGANQYQIYQYGVHFNAANAKPDDYDFDLCTGDHTNPMTVSTIAGSQMTMRPLVNANQVGYQHWDDWTTNVNGGTPAVIGSITGGTHWLGFRIVDAPDNMSERSSGITVTVFLRRQT